MIAEVVDCLHAIVGRSIAAATSLTAAAAAVRNNKISNGHGWRSRRKSGLLTREGRRKSK